MYKLYYNYKFKLLIIKINTLSIPILIQLCIGINMAVMIVIAVQCTVYSVQCTVYSVQCTVYTV